MLSLGNVVKVVGDKLILQIDYRTRREITKKKITKIELRLDDGRTISAEQRRKIFAIIRDIALWSGHEPEEIRAYLQWDFRLKRFVEDFSLSDVDMTTAREFITYLIGFCFYHNVPTRDTLLNETDDIGKYLYQCLEHRKCAICNDPAEVHHVDRIGIGRDREKIVHVGLRAIALCRKHHDEAHRDEKALFEKNHVYGIRLDSFLCDKLNLKKE